MAETATASHTRAIPGAKLVSPAVVKAFGNVIFTLVLTFAGLTAVTFTIGRVMPADPVLAVVGGRASNEVYQKVYLVDPVTGFILIDAALAREWEIFENAISHLLLPSLILGTYALAYIARMTRSFMLDQLSEEYVLTARVKGVSELAVIWRHAFRNVLVQLITIIGLTYASLLEGSVLTETVFSWPGIGQYITTSLFNADMNAVLGGTIVIGVCFVGINMLSDVLYKLVDPRARA